MTWLMKGIEMNIFKEIEKAFGFTDKGLARKTDPETSKQAASTVDATKLEIIVLEAIRSFPNGCISEQVENVLYPIKASSITPRYRPLLKKNLIEDTGERRAGSSGRSQRVLRAI